MADPTPSLTEIAPESAPPSVSPSVTPLTRDQLSAELGKSLRVPGVDKPQQRSEPKTESQPEHEKPREYQPKREQTPPKGALPDFKAAIRDKVLAKKEEPEVKSEEPKPVKKEVVSADDAAPPKPKTDEEVPEDQRQVLPHDKPETARRMKAILADKAKAVAEKAELAKELEVARKAVTNNPTQANLDEFTKLKEEHAKANDELIKFRRRYEVDNDETFRKNYDEPVAHAEASIENTLKKYNLGDATLKAIKDEGGFAAFSRSTKTFPIVEIGEDGERKTVQRTAGELARNWLNVIPVADAEFIKQSLGKQQMLSEEKKTAVTRAVDESKQFFEQRQAQSKQQQEAAQKQATDTAKHYQDWLKTTTESTDWLKDKDIPDNASDAQKKSLKEHNEFNKQLRESLSVHPKNDQDYYNMRLEGAEAHHLRREVGSKDDRIKALEAELARVKGGTRTTPKAGSLLTNANKEEPKTEPDMSDPLGAMKKGLRSSMSRKMGNADDE